MFEKCSLQNCLDIGLGYTPVTTYPLFSEPLRLFLILPVTRATPLTPPSYSISLFPLKVIVLIKLAFSI